jgi:hypothetical protein
MSSLQQPRTIRSLLGNWEPSDGLLLLVIALAYLPFIFFGYGSDPDTGNVLISVRSLLQDHAYAMSRVPGHVPHEVGSALLSLLGGSVLSNAGSVAMALVACYSFIRICRTLEIPHRKLLLLLFAFQPVLWVHATYTIDSAWALGFLLAGFCLFLEGKRAWGSIVWGFAIGTRLPFILIVAAFVLWFFLQKEISLRETFSYGLIILAVSVVLFIPPFLSTGADFSFLIVFTESLKFDLAGWVGRFGYKNIYFWGLQTVVALVLISPWIIRGIKKQRSAFKSTFVLSLLVCLATELLFMYMPTKRPFLLPMLPFVLIVLGIALADHRRLLIALLIVQLSYAVVDFNLAQPDVPGHATSAQIGFWIEPGYLTTDIQSRVYGTPRKP